MGVEVFINLHNIGVRVDSRETEKTLTDYMGQVNDSGQLQTRIQIFTSQPFFHAILLPYEQFVELFGLLVAWRGRVVSDVVRHGY